MSAVHLEVEAAADVEQGGPEVTRRSVFTTSLTASTSYLRVNATQHFFLLAWFLFYLMSSILRARWHLQRMMGGLREKSFSFGNTVSALAKLLWHFPHDKKSRRAKCPPNRQLHAAAKASKSLPDHCSADQGGKERHRERTARRNK